MKRGYFYTKYRKIYNFLLDNDFILRKKWHDSTRYEVLVWNHDYMKQFNQM